MSKSFSKTQYLDFFICPNTLFGLCHSPKRTFDFDISPSTFVTFPFSETHFFRDLLLQIFHIHVGNLMGVSTLHQVSTLSFSQIHFGLCHLPKRTRSAPYFCSTFIYLQETWWTFPNSIRFWRCHFLKHSSYFAICPNALFPRLTFAVLSYADRKLDGLFKTPSGLYCVISSNTLLILPFSHTHSFRDWLLHHFRRKPDGLFKTPSSLDSVIFSNTILTLPFSQTPSFRDLLL